MSRRLLLSYWLALAFAHFLLDMIGGMFPPALPGLMRDYNVSLAVVTLVPAIYGIVCNVAQVPFGRLSDRSPVYGSLMLLTPIFCCVPLFLGLVGSFQAICSLLIVGGLALALFHPTGMWEVQCLGGGSENAEPASCRFSAVTPADEGPAVPPQADAPALPRGIIVAVFMALGLCGWACGSYVSATIIEHPHLGIRYLWLPIIPAALLAGALFILRGKVGIARASMTGEHRHYDRFRPRGYSFAMIMISGTLVATACTVFITYLPTYIKESMGAAGTVLPGGTASMFFGLFGAAGAIFYGILSHRLPRGYVCAFALAISSVCLGVYFVADHRLIWFELSGLGLGSAFPMLVSMSHEAKGHGSNMRNGWIVGGCWGTAAVLLLVAGSVADSASRGLAAVLPWITLLVPIPAVMLLIMEIRNQREMRLKA